MKANHFLLKPVKIAGLLILCLSLTVSCSKDDPDPVNEEETITRVTLVFTEGGTENTYIYNVDEDAPLITLEQGLEYEVRVIFEDASDPGDVEDITEEVIEEADDHFVFYQVNDLSLDLENADSDVEDTSGNRIGIHTTWSPTGVGDGTVTIYLIHEPTGKTGTVRDDFGGEDDVQLSFDISIVVP